MANVSFSEDQFSSEDEKITDEDAIEGVTLLMSDEASIWWISVKEEVTTWANVLKILRTTFAPKRPAYK
ncbi:Retrotransposon gag protein [Operophtera brumata]|uniref:Retrotransposon gag protein n=1 Tax=Operophtera brumata TaxID=104452 RepID=A0A0L7LE78_OPEBR|nr:Retrotransposon gag protein [Operophtera brumata]